MQPGQLLSFGDLLKHYRNAAGLTQEELATQAGLSAKGISALESGIRRPRHYTASVLANALNLAAQDRAIFEAAVRRLPRRGSTADALQAPPSGSEASQAQSLLARSEQARGPLAPQPPTLAQPISPVPGPRVSRFSISHDRLMVGGRAIRWIVLGRARYEQEHIHCFYHPAPVPLVPDFERMLKDYRRDWARRQKSGEVGLPYNAETYKLRRFQVGYRQIIDGEEVPELLLEFGPTDYFTQIITDFNVENPIRRRYAAAASITEQPVPEFASIVGVNLSLITSDQLLIVTRRSSQSFPAGGSLHTSVGENLFRPKDAAPSGAPDLFAAAARGALEEMGVALQPKDIVFSAFGVEPQLCQYSLIGTVRLQQTGAEMEDIRQKGIPKDKWESRHLYFVPFDLENVAQFVIEYWDSWFPVGLAAVVMSLLDAGYSGEEVDAAFARTGAGQVFAPAPFRPL